jgi:hypothetical protein
MNASEITRQIDDSLTPDALSWWNGCDSETVNEIIQLARREGIQAAVAEIEELAKPVGQD